MIFNLSNKIIVILYILLLFQKLFSHIIFHAFFFNYTKPLTLYRFKLILNNFFICSLLFPLLSFKIFSNCFIVFPMHIKVLIGILKLNKMFWKFDFIFLLCQVFTLLTIMIWYLIEAISLCNLDIPLIVRYLLSLLLRLYIYMILYVTILGGHIYKLILILCDLGRIPLLL